jgi:Phage integrase, N-terminal SAM-like domain
MSTRSSPLRQRMIEDMNARQLRPHSQRSHIYSCERLAAFLKRSPDTASADDVRRFHQQLLTPNLEQLRPEAPESRRLVGKRDHFLGGFFDSMPLSKNLL